jgi:hypothetical protein
VEAGEDNEGAIDGVGCACLGVWVGRVGVGAIVADVKEGVKLGHVMAHVACPFEDLGAGVGQECMAKNQAPIIRPATMARAQL